MVERFVDSQMQLADKDGSGSIDFDEFLLVYNKMVANATAGGSVCKGKEGECREEVMEERCRVAKEGERDSIFLFCFPFSFIPPSLQHLHC